MSRFYKKSVRGALVGSLESQPGHGSLDQNGRRAKTSSSWLPSAISGLLKIIPSQADPWDIRNPVTMGLTPVNRYLPIIEINASVKYCKNQGFRNWAEQND